MVFPDLAANLIYTVLCLVPGYVTVRTAVHVSGRAWDYDEFDRSTLSLLASGLTLSLAYLGYVGARAVATGRPRLLVPVDLQWYELVAAYPLLLAVAVAVGYAAGRVLAPTVPPEATPEGGPDAGP